MGKRERGGGREGGRDIDIINCLRRYKVDCNQYNMADTQLNTLLINFTSILHADNFNTCTAHVYTLYLSHAIGI